MCAHGMRVCVCLHLCVLVCECVLVCPCMSVHAHSMYVYMCVCVHMVCVCMPHALGVCVCRCTFCVHANVYLHTCVHVRRPEVNCPPCFFKTRSLTSLESITQAKQADQQSLGVLLSPLMPNPVLGFLMCHLPCLFFLGSGGLNPGLYTSSQVFYD